MNDEKPACGGFDDSGDETVAIEVSGRTAERLNEVAWSFGVDRQALLRRLCEKAAEQSRH